MEAHTASLWAASVLPPFQDQGVLSTAQVVDDEENSFELRERLKVEASGPIIVLPIFTRCKGACPALAQGLRSAATELREKFQQVSVVIYSFDPSDSSADLKSFRDTQRLPLNWWLVRSDSDNSKKFFDSLRYSYRDEEGDFIHPNQFFIFSSDLIWKATVVGTDFTPQDLEQGLILARGDLGFLKGLFLFPEKMAVAAGCLFAAILIGLVFYMSRRGR